MKFTKIDAKQLKDHIEKTNHDGLRSFCQNDCTPYDRNGQKINLGYNIEFISSERSDSGDHDMWELIFKANDQYFMATSYYSSQEGIDWSYADFYEVKPVEVKYTKYQIV